MHNKSTSPRNSPTTPHNPLILKRLRSSGLIFVFVFDFYFWHDFTHLSFEDVVMKMKKSWEGGIEKIGWYRPWVTTTYLRHQASGSSLHHRHPSVDPASPPNSPHYLKRGFQQGEVKSGWPRRTRWRAQNEADLLRQRSAVVCLAAVLAGAGIDASSLKQYCGADRDWKGPLLGCYEGHLVIKQPAKRLD